MAYPPEFDSLLTGSSSPQTLFSLRELAVGGGGSGSITIKNLGSLAGRYTLTGETSGSAELAHHLRLVISSAGETVYAGPLSQLGSVELGRFAPAGEPGSSHTYRFHVELESGSSANELQGLQAGASFAWTAVPA